MEKLTSAQIRTRFVEYFRKHQHEVVESSSLIPENDPTLLFANAGMNQFKNVFLGLEHRDSKRAVSYQKVVRAGGKHNDLDNVGFTARHHTFFEMLGNFSFGDYFKKEAIHFAWEFLTRDLQIPKDRLYVTVFENDDEAADIWHQQEGVPKDRIFRLGEKDNFWRMGDVGPCGPCSEIFYDHGPHAGHESDPLTGIKAGEDRFVEIWNLVFMQFYEKSPGVMEPLPKPSVDTGSGLERVTAALQGKLNNYDTDLFWPLITRAAEISGRKSLLHSIEILNRDGVHAKVSTDDKKMIAALRVVADHTRSCVFLLADGALPSNEGRGYVLRRILRRGVRFANLLADGKAFLPEMARLLIDHMASAYPELKQRQSQILATIQDEQERFLVTLGTGEALLKEELQKLKGQKTLPGALVFKLYDTHGFPADLTRLMAEEHGLTVDEKAFESDMEQARDRAKASWKGKGPAANETHVVQLAQAAKDKMGATVFVGYDELMTQQKIQFLSDGQQTQQSLRQGQFGLVITEKTAFYAEGGGQVGDQGDIHWADGEARILTTTKQNEIYIHHVEILRGELKINTLADLKVAVSERRATAANHSATHLMHSALRQVLGDHVGQAGSAVDGTRLRFDFTHTKALTSTEIQTVENLVNREISSANPVVAKVLPYKQAISEGAIAMFGEKYGDKVRVLSMGDFSTELCGGTHVSNTAQIQVFKIVSESGVSAGVRRIEALTGLGALNFLQRHAEQNQRARQKLGWTESWQSFLESTNEPASILEERQTQIRNLEREIKKLQSDQIDLSAILAQASAFTTGAGAGQIAFADLEIEDRDVLAQITDQLKNKIQSGVVVVLGKGMDSHPVIVSVTKNLNPGVSAGALLKEIAAAMGGKGGGRPDFAQGAVPDRAKWNDAKSRALKVLGH